MEWNDESLISGTAKRKCRSKHGINNNQIERNILFVRKGKKVNITDPVADMLTRIRNANTSRHKTVDVPCSKMKLSIADILFKEGYIKSYEEIKDVNTQGVIRITLKYDEKGTRVIDGLKRISKPGLKVYAGKDELPKVLNGLGIAIISTSKGLMTDKQARELGIGGEVLAYIW